MNVSQIDGPIMVPLTFDVDGNATSFEAGYHCNIAAWDMDPAYEAYRIEPTTPTRIFAGDVAPYAETVFLKFADEAEMQSVLDPR